jgi:hypothetical protein
MNKAKQDVENLKNFSAHLVHRLSAPEAKPTPEAEPETEKEDAEENVEE